MARTVIGIFSDTNDAETAIDKLKEDGYNPKDISIMMKDRKESKEVGKDTGANVAGGAMSGVATGAVLGGIAGLAASTILPGLGAFFIGGPIAASLGLTGAAATTASGATTGALAGGVVGILSGFGIAKEDAEKYERHINEGKILVAVPTAEDTAKVEDVLEGCNAENVKSFSTA